MLIVALDAPVSGLEAPLCEANLIQEDQLAVLCLSSIQSGDAFFLAVVEIYQHVSWLVFFLTDLLSLHAMPQVEFSKRCHCNSLVRELSVEKYRPLSESFTRPFL